MPISPEVLAGVLKDCTTPKQMFGSDGLLQQRTEALIQRSLQAEMTYHLSYEKHDPASDNFGNSESPVPTGSQS